MKAYLVVCTERDYDETFTSQIIGGYLNEDKAQQHLEEILGQFRGYDEAHLAYCTEVVEIAKGWIEQSGISDRSFTLREVNRCYGVLGLINQIKALSISQVANYDVDRLSRDINTIIYTMKLKSFAPKFPAQPAYVSLHGTPDDYQVIEVELDVV